MNSGILVERMLQSLSASSPIDEYLKVFGVTTISKDMPIVFDAQYAPQWRAFLKDRKYSTKDPKLQVLLTILDFVKFMRSQRTNPFLVIKGNSLNSIIRPVDMEQTILKAEIKETYDTVVNYLRKTSVLAFLTVAKRTVQLSLDRKSVNVNLMLVPLRTESVHAILPRLSGFLYKTKKPPVQLTYTEKTQRFNSLVATINTSPSVWLPLTSIQNFKVFGAISKEALAVRIVIPVNFDLVHTPRELQTLCRYWKMVK